jgi:hypothetical protein
MDQLEQLKSRIDRLRTRLAKIESERSNLLKQLNDYETTVRVLQEFGGAPIAGSESTDESEVSASTRPYPVKLSDAVLEAVVSSMPEGILGHEVSSWIEAKHGFSPKPNSVVGTLQRHRQRDVIENKGGRWFTTGSQTSNEDEPRGTDEVPRDFRLIANS